MSKTSLSTLLVAAAGLLLSLPGLAQQAKSTEALIVERLQQARPDLEFAQPRPSPISGLYQVQVVGGPVLYVTPEADKFVVGDMFSITPSGFGRVEDPYLVDLRLAYLKGFQAKDSIIYPPKGETKAVVYVFTDVDCGFCRRLHHHINSYRDEQGQTKPGYSDLGIEIRYLAYPRAGVSSPSGDKLVTAWCAANPQQVMDRLKNLQAVTTARCPEHPVADQYRQGAELGVTGTPALLLADGSLVGGYLPPEELARRLGL